MTSRGNLTRECAPALACVMVTDDRDRDRRRTLWLALACALLILAIAQVDEHRRYQRALDGYQRQLASRAAQSKKSARSSTD